jgi:hypothetical protein
MIQHGEGKVAGPGPVVIVKCPCGHKGCNTYGLSDGLFYQGCGWSRERAQQYADAINAVDKALARTKPVNAGLFPGPAEREC